VKRTGAALVSTKVSFVLRRLFSPLVAIHGREERSCLTEGLFDASPGEPVEPEVADVPEEADEPEDEADESEESDVDAGLDPPPSAVPPGPDSCTAGALVEGVRAEVTGV